MSTINDNTHLCILCPHKQGTGPRVAGRRDPAPRKFWGIAKEGDCPAGKFNGPPEPDGSTSSLVPGPSPEAPKKADEPTVARRQEICRACPDASLLMGQLDRCGRCTCQLENRVLWQGNSCPAGKW